jgi:hypothetical protein
LLSNVSACTDVMNTTMAMLRAACRDISVYSPEIPCISGVHRNVTLSTLATCAKEGQAVCHHCALDPKQGIWTLASCHENGEGVLMAVKGTLSKQNQQLERMCLYRMHVSRVLGECVSAELMGQTLPPQVQGDSLSYPERLLKMKVWPLFLDGCATAMCKLAACQRSLVHS